MSDGVMQTYWNGELCKATRVQVIVGKPLRPTWWCAHLEGKEHPAIKIECDGSEPFYIDDQPSAWKKITTGLGSPTLGHRSVPVAREIEVKSPLKACREMTIQKLEVLEKRDLIALIVANVDEIVKLKTENGLLKMARKDNLCDICFDSLKEGDL